MQQTIQPVIDKLNPTIDNNTETNNNILSNSIITNIITKYNQSNKIIHYLFNKAQQIL